LFKAFKLKNTLFPSYHTLLFGRASALSKSYGANPFGFVMRESPEMKSRELSPFSTKLTIYAMDIKVKTIPIVFKTFQIFSALKPARLCQRTTIGVFCGEEGFVNGG